MKQIVLAAGFLFAIASAASAEGLLHNGLWVSAPESVVKYHVFFKLHPVHGESKAVEGRARLGDELVELQVRVPTASFDSGNKNRDANAHDAMLGARHPMIEFKAVGKPCRPTVEGCTFDARGELLFGGVKQAYVVPVTLSWISPEKVTADFTFSVTLSKHDLERPALLFLKVEDRFDVHGTLVMEHRP